MVLQSLVVSDDKQAVRGLRTILRDLGIGTQVWSTAAQAGEALGCQRFALVVLDCELPGANGILYRIRKASSSSAAPVFLLGPRARESQTAFTTEPDFLLPRPLSLEQTWRTLRSARQRMELAIARCRRVRIETEAVVTRAGGRQVRFHTRDVGLRGIGLASTEPLQPGEEVEVRFVLPGCDQSIEARAEVVWANDIGHSGLHFLALSDDGIPALHAWIAQQLGTNEMQFDLDNSDASGSFSDLSPDALRS